MIKSIKLLLLTSALTLLYFSALNLFLKKTSQLPFYSETVEKENYDKFIKKKDSAHVIISGDSHPQDAIDEFLIPQNWVKVTHRGETFNLRVQKLEYMINNSSSIKYIIIPLDYHSFYNSNGTFDQGYYIYQKGLLANFLKRNELLDDYNRKITINTFISLINKHFLNKFAQNQTASQQATNQQIEYQQHIQNIISGMLNSPAIDKDAIVQFQRLVSICQQKNIKLIGVRFPVPPYYIDQVKKKNLNQMDQWVDENKQHFHEIFDYRYYFTNLDKNNETNYFKNDDHLNTKGMKLFTQTFITDIFSILDKDTLQEDQNSLVKEYPPILPIVKSLNPDVSILDISTFNQIEKDEEESTSWLWLGEGEGEGLKLSLFSKKDMKLGINYNATLSNNVVLITTINGKKVDDNNISLNQGVNTLTTYSIKKNNNIIKPTRTTDPRNLFIRLFSLEILPN